MKFGLIHYNAPGETLEAFLDYAAGAGFDGVELQIPDIWNESDADAKPEANAEKVSKLVASKGLIVGALSGNNDFLTSDAALLQAQGERMKRVIEIASIMGVDRIRCDGGWPREGKPMPEEEYWADAIAAGFRICMPTAEKLGVRIGLDNHGTVTNDARFQLMVCGLVGSPNLGTVMDTLNYHWMGHDIPTCNRFYELSAQRAVHIHLKDGTGTRGDYKGCVLGQGEIDLAHAVRALKANGYDGLWCAEYEGREADGYTQCLAWMKANVPAL